MAKFVKRPEFDSHVSCQHTSDEAGRRFQCTGTAARFRSAKSTLLPSTNKNAPPGACVPCCVTTTIITIITLPVLQNFNNCARTTCTIDLLRVLVPVACYSSTCVRVLTCQYIDMYFKFPAHHRSSSYIIITVNERPPTHVKACNQTTTWAMQEVYPHPRIKLNFWQQQPFWLPSFFAR